MKSIIYVFLCLLATSAYGQKETRSNKFYISLYEFAPEVVLPTHQKVLESIFYERQINSNFRAILGLSYTDYHYDSSKEHPGSTFIENSFYKNINLSLGGIYQCSKWQTNRIKPALQADVYFSKANYEGVSGGGITGIYHAFDEKISSIGLIGRVRVDFYLFKNVILSPMTSLRFASVNGSEEYPKKTDLSWLPLDFRLGFAF